MTRLLDEAVATIAGLPEDQKDELARVLLRLVGYGPSVYILTAEEEADLDASISEAARGEFATDADVEAIWANMAVDDAGLPVDIYSRLPVADT